MTKNPYGGPDYPAAPAGVWNEGYEAGFAAGRAAATPDPPKDERRPWPIAPDTVMPSRRQPVRWGSRADDPPTDIHDDPQRTKAYLAGLAAGRTEASAASPDPHDWTSAITTLRHAMCCPAGRAQVEKDLLRPFGYPTESQFTEAAASPDERLREALAFYADKSNYTAQNPVGSGAHVWRDMGQRARAALAADRDSLAEKPETDT